MLWCSLQDLPFNRHQPKLSLAISPAMKAKWHLSYASATWRPHSRRALLNLSFLCSALSCKMQAQIFLVTSSNMQHLSSGSRCCSYLVATQRSSAHTDTAHTVFTLSIWIQQLSFKAKPKCSATLLFHCPPPTLHLPNPNRRLTLADHKNLSRLITWGLWFGGLHLVEELLEDPQEGLVVPRTEDLGDEPASLGQEVRGQLESRERKVSWERKWSRGKQQWMRARGKSVQTTDLTTSTQQATGTVTHVLHHLLLTYFNRHLFIPETPPTSYHENIEMLTQ